MKVGKQLQQPQSHSAIKSYVT